MWRWTFAAARRTSVNGLPYACRLKTTVNCGSPEGFAHGFVVLSEFAEFLYKTTNYYDPSSERSIRWNDPALGIDWQLDEAPKLSAKDQVGALLKDADVFA